MCIKSSSTNTSSEMKTFLLPTPNRKRVRFEEQAVVTSSELSHHVSSTAPLKALPLSSALYDSQVEKEQQRPIKKRVVCWLPLCSELTPAEKQERWIQREERDEIRASANWQAAQCRSLSHSSLSPCVETYTHVYALCQQQQEPSHSTLFIFNNDEKGVATTGYEEEMSLLSSEAAMKVLPELLSYMAGNCTEMRGLEDRAVPWLGIERRLTRIKTIRTIVQINQICQDAEVVRMISRTLTNPARRLGQALALVDATAAMREYEGVA